MEKEKIFGKTPNGGDYSIALYINEKGDLVKPNEATKIIIKEYTKDGNLIQETIGFTKKIFSTAIELGLNGTENTI